VLGAAIIIFLGFVTLTICLTDFRTMIIPDWINATVAVTGAAASIFLFKQDWFVVAGVAAATGVLFMALAKSYQQARGVSGLGMGDIKFLTAASTWVGISGLPWLILFACIGALAHVLVRQFAGHEIARFTRIPFGPYLSVALVLVWSLKLAV
jgi:leader peptidase (prepilin peptidase) / N-methyltransferase